MNITLTFKCILFTFCMFLVVEKALAADDNSSNWYESKEEAFSVAKEQNKHVLLIMGSDDCSNCKIVKNFLNRPELKVITDKSYILWYCDTNKSDEGYVYDGMYPSAYIPLVCIINPNDPMSPLHHSNGMVSANNLKTALENNQPTGNQTISDITTQAYISDNTLTLSNVFTDEIISIYTLNGQLVDLFPKKEYTITRIIPSLPTGLLLICSSEKWSRKILNKLA